MRVEQVQVRNFMSHDAFSLALPPSGIVVITGRNGAGKSSVIEAVSMALWGKTLRGSSPWRVKMGGEVSLSVDGETVRRAVSDGGRTTVSGSALPEFDTAKEAQRLIAARWGEREVWQRTSVFSASDAAGFTLATDAERKRLLETLLGLDKFEQALQAVRQDLKDAQRDLASAIQLRQSKLAERSAAERSIPQLTQALESLEALTQGSGWTPQQDVLLSQLSQALGEAKRDAEATNKRLRYLDREMASTKTTADAAKATVVRLQSLGECPTCGQVVAPARLQQASLEAARLLAEHQSCAADKQAEVAHCVSALEALEEEITDLSTSVQALQATHREVAASAERVKKAEREASNAKALVSQLRDDIVSLDAALAEADAEIARLTTLCHLLGASERVLGLRGVRAQVTASALTGLETVANHWLKRIAGSSLKLSLSATSALKSGGEAEVISLQLDGAGGGHGYPGASAGERRRIDVALLFALAETAAAAHGSVPGTLWVDEAFDSLDTAGVTAVCSALSDIASERCVVVITHNDDLASRLDAAHRVDLA